MLSLYPSRDALSQEELSAYRDAHCGADVDSNERRDLARSFGFERIRGVALFDDPRSKESEMYYRSSLWTAIGNPVAVATDLEVGGVDYTSLPDKARGAVAQLFQHKRDTALA